MAPVTSAPPAAAARYPSPRALLEKYGLRAKKSWGQNFLGDEAILDDIARLAAPRAGDRVVELGAGLGHLTARLLARGAEVIAVERDRDMARVLRGELGQRVRLLEADAARIDYGEVARAFEAPAAPAGSARRLAVVGNLPYHLTSPILFSLLDQLDHVSRAVFLLQREVAERLAAAPGTRDWGLASVLLQREADVSVERIVPPGAFLPPPNVESAVLCALFRPPGDALRVADPARFRRLVKAGFAQRRKTLANALRAGRVVPDDALARALEAAGIDPSRRGETLTVAEWAALDRALGT
ncbi:MULTISPECIES: 16S rRNA (adenine(1518)-N(6)/adenine(1519)-N(6))-dimethyltransferase RsmA [Anaeromyxobacter]|uniref:16S rRNA (adenine(1518)-N(6)/adenine(1519)-N(6))- dimethyltransferase RsmA n=1 Tax=Anaeromyxobacter TaxID=161492 RepID=UPI001F590237|nr:MULTISPECIES: 16S rRNA (adenine(1518)-N(6)/adenine(1519)-N(6))-dimethyltransferase RsmA [unclassified Anaeromyxobacter]